MPSPSSTLATLRPDLAGSLMEFELEADRNGFIAQRVAPVVEVGRQSGKIGKIPLEQLLQQRTTARSPGGGYNRGNFTFTDFSYATEEHGAEEPIDRREAAMYAEYIDAEMIATQRARDAVLRNAEIRVASMLFNATTWTGSSLATQISNEWDDLANAVPTTDVEAAVRKVYDGTGLWPNALVINRRVFRNLRNCAQIVDRVKAQNFMDVRAGNITADMLSAVFDLPYIIVAGSSKNSANEGATATPTQIWSDEYAMVCRIAETRDHREPCVARTFHWGEDGSEMGGLVEEYYEESVRSDIIRCRHDVDEVVVYTECGHLLYNVTT